LLVPFAVLCLGLGPSASTAARPEPETLFELIHSFDAKFARILTPAESEAYASGTPDEIRAISPGLYDKIRRHVESRTEAWIREAARTHRKLSDKKRGRALDAVARVDRVMRPYFESRGWPYRTISVVFLPQRLFFDERRRGATTAGVFVPFYPEVFFATVDTNYPLELILAHETIHFNQQGSWLGRPLVEGITDRLARDLSASHGLVTEKKARRFVTYRRERALVDEIVTAIAERTGCDRAAALDMLVEAYVTGHPGRVEEALGSESWASLLEASRSAWGWHLVKRGVREALD